MTRPETPEERRKRQSRESSQRYRDRRRVSRTCRYIAMADDIWAVFAMRVDIDDPEALGELIEDDSGA